ncbi:T9SS type A sorting domain-containing protein [Bacteroidia bacterium]|nr:T9SS type A sorting domain-containing protein [Bacteroidia bacterium]MDC1394996.1 T9SS type A sorting domain-containing protein [Bacteroidia bacterium]
MNKIITSLFLILSFSAFAQTSDSIIPASGALEVYYDFETQTKTSVTRTSWDIGLTTNPRGASIIINEMVGVELFLYSMDINEWETLDTNGMSWDNLYNSQSTWDEGAFSNQGTSHPDYGWGVYNMNTHDIVGNRIFIIRTAEGFYLKMVVEKLSPSGDYTFKTAKLDGSDLKNHSFSKSANAAKNFGLLDLLTGDFVTTNPERKDWDILFTKYITTVIQGPASRDMLVSGVKLNVNCRVAERSGDVTSDDTTNLSWSTNITEIGYDWKAFDRDNYKYDITPDLAYFVSTENGAMYKIWFTKYTLGSGNFFFNTKQLKEGVLSTNNIQKLNTQVYPNPSNGLLTIANEEKEELTVKLINMHGAVMATESIAALANTQLVTSDFAKGIYFLQLSTSATSNTQRVIFE